MEQLIKSLARNQKLQDIGAVFRGADRVFSVYWRHMGKNILYPLVTIFHIFHLLKIYQRIPVNPEASNTTMKKKSSTIAMLTMILPENLTMEKINHSP